MTPQDLLHLHPFFSTLTARDGQKLLLLTRSKRVSAGQVVFHKEEPGDGLYGVLAGRIAFTVDSVEGKELTLNVLGPGEFFGEIALLDGKGRTASAVARDASELLFIARKDFLSFVSQRPDTMIHIMELLCAHLRRSTDYISDFAFLSLSRRLAKQLVILLNDGVSPSGRGLRVSHAELASMLGVSRERVSRELAAWSGKGILEQGRGRLIVRDRGALEHVIAGPG
jgi:CRP/FNR family transcriptional regulator, cyclic AMP receptor protein